MAGPERALPPPAADTPLLDFLLAALAPMNRTRVKEVLRSGRVRVNGAAVTRHDHRVRPADRVSVTRDAPTPTASLPNCASSTKTRTSS
jgi:23S rRNA pseudouridine1911/1915/1917 synthase